MPSPPFSISILSSAHDPTDERIYYHFAHSFREKGHAVSIICSSKELNREEKGISFASFDSSRMGIKSKIRGFYDRLVAFQPTLVLCQEPMPMIAAFWYKKMSTSRVKVVYDITEWHPSLTQLKNYPSLVSKILHGIGLGFFNLFMASFADAFIFGEMCKRFPYRYLFPFKKSTLIGYYPSPAFFVRPSSLQIKQQEEWVFGYTGALTKERGIFHFLDAVVELLQRHPSLRIRLLLIGDFENARDRELFGRRVKDHPYIHLSFYPRLDFQAFCQYIHEMDICFDLREISWERNNSLPIKLFYYMACAKPVIYSDLKAIRLDVEEISEFGYLVTPEKSGEIVIALESYLFNPLLYKKHCEAAARHFHNTYNWVNLEPKLHDFVDRLIHD